MSNDSTIKRLKKLLVLSQDGANEHESLLAAERLATLCAKHNISIETLAEDDEEHEVGSDGIEQRRRPWKGWVAMAVADLYFCKVYTSWITANKSSYIFVGSEANRLFAIHIFTAIMKLIPAESRKASREQYDGELVNSFLNSFEQGAAHRIRERCAELVRLGKAGELQDEGGNMLPVLVNIYDQNKARNEAFCNNLGLVNVRGRARSGNHAGSNAGRAAGDKVQLSRQLQGNAGPKLITG